MNKNLATKVVARFLQPFSSLTYHFDNDEDVTGLKKKGIMRGRARCGVEVASDFVRHITEAIQRLS